jgi:mannose-6-phosphate isomerase-like protein (cupin superfamily)
MHVTHASGRRGRAVSVEAAAPAGFMPPLHAHEADEAVQVIEGAVTVFAGAERVDLAPGESFVVPAGVPHTFRAMGAPAQAVFTTVTASPGSYESFLRATGPALPGGGWSGDDDEAVVAAVAAAARTAVHGPPGALPIA